MTKILLILTIVLGALWYRQYQASNVPPPPPPAALATMQPPVLGEDEIEKIRIASKDTDPTVRWTAIELLYRLHDPQAMKILEDTMSVDTEPRVRANALALLKNSGKPGVTKDLVRALRDTEKEIRMSALIALGEQGDATALPHVAALTVDVETDVRRQALQTLGRIQERRLAEYEAEKARLEREYQESLKRGRPAGDGTGSIFKDRLGGSR